MAACPNNDIMRFNNAGINWTLKELDRYSSAFAFGLLEAGFARGDRLLVWVDRTRSAESLIAQFAAYKTGVEVVCFHENNNKDALHHALGGAGVKGVLFTPNSNVGGGENRSDLLNSLVPELSTTYLGEELNSSAYPNLDLVIQTEFGHIPGVNRFKDITVYNTPSMSSYSIPENQPDDVCMRVLKGGVEHRVFTS